MTGTIKISTLLMTCSIRRHGLAVHNTKKGKNNILKALASAFFVSEASYSN
jgi:hypothetical protein